MTNNGQQFIFQFIYIAGLFNCGPLEPTKKPRVAYIAYYSAAFV